MSGRASGLSSVFTERCVAPCFALLLFLSTHLSRPTTHRSCVPTEFKPYITFPDLGGGGKTKSRCHCPRGVPYALCLVWRCPRSDESSVGEQDLRPTPCRFQPYPPAPAFLHRGLSVASYQVLQHGFSRSTSTDGCGPLLAGKGNGPFHTCARGIRRSPGTMARRSVPGAVGVTTCA